VLSAPRLRLRPVVVRHDHSGAEVTFAQRFREFVSLSCKSQSIESSCSRRGALTSARLSIDWSSSTTPSFRFVTVALRAKPSNSN